MGKGCGEVKGKELWANLVGGGLLGVYTVLFWGDVVGRERKEGKKLE